MLFGIATIALPITVATWLLNTSVSGELGSPLKKPAVVATSPSSPNTSPSQRPLTPRFSFGLPACLSRSISRRRASAERHAAERFHLPLGPGRCRHERQADEQDPHPDETPHRLPGEQREEYPRKRRRRHIPLLEWERFHRARTVGHHHQAESARRQHHHHRR